MKITVIQPGTKIYHGSEHRIPGGIPNRSSGSWFSTNRNQSAYHSMAGNHNQRVLYEYTVIKPMRIVSFESIPNFNKWAISRGHVLNPSYNSFVFGAGNIAVAAKMCNESIYDGWALPSLQRQIMICKPRNFLQLAQVYRIKSNVNPRNINFPNKINAAGNLLWKAPPNTKYNLQPVKINNLENVNEPYKNRIYWYWKNKRTPRFINSSGVILAEGMNAFVKDTSGTPTGLRLKNNKILRFNLPANGSIVQKISGNVPYRHQTTLKKRSNLNITGFSSIKLKNNRV